VIDIARIIEDVSGRYARHYTDAISDLLIAIARDNAPATRASRMRLAEITRQTMGVAEVLGATSTLTAAGGVAQFSSQGIVPSVTFEEAGADMVARVPKTITDAAERTWRRISHLYSTEHAMAFVRSAEDSVTRRVQDLIVQMQRDGVTELEAGRRITMGVEQIREITRPWSESYSRMVFRTNVSTATTAGRFRAAMDPDVAAIIPAMRFTTAGDSDVRPNHRADGFIAKTTNPVWRWLAPPLAWSCRCRIDHMTRPQLRRAGALHEDGTVRESRVPAGVHPDEGFRTQGRVDLGLGVGGIA